MNVEVWLSIPSTAGFYEASNLGRIRRAKPSSPPNGVQAGRIKHPRRGRYQTVSLWVAGHGSQATVHQLVAETFLGPRPPEMQVNHKNGIKHDNRAENLEYVTPKENHQHAARNGWKPRGERHWGAILSEEDVRLLRSSYKGKRGDLTRLARQFGVSISEVWMIVNDKAWRWLDA